MDKKIYTIGVLSIIAAILFVANLSPLGNQPAQGAFSIKDNRYQLITTRAQKGGESLYVIDNMTGQVAVLVWENNTIKPIVIRPLTELFK